MRRIISFLLALLVPVGLLQAEAPFSFAATPGKLPKDIAPRHYAVEITPDLPTLTHTGVVTIDLEILRPTRRIVLNAFQLEITRALLLHGENRDLKPQLNEAEQTVSFDVPVELKPGRCELRLEFKGRIAKQPEGLYHDRYQTSVGEKILLATQMEPVFARRMFPCWDEPVFRATFDLRVVVPEKWTVMFNMPQTAERVLPGKGMKEVRFAKTPSMPAYLFVFAAGEFEALEDEVDGIKLRIFTTAGKRESARYAMQCTKQILHYYNEYFGVKFPLPKLDQLATPGGFGGAMENWGGIIYNEARLLFDPAKSSEETREGCFRIIAHEVAHQWFGDLVTMAWWDNLWLNEGFASWMGTKATDHFNPGWQVWLRANRARETVMPQDARRTTHPIQTPVRDEAGANSAFDDITYVKGQGFLRMLETHLGEEKFRAGMRLYMKRHQLSNTTTQDLWAALEEGSGQPVRGIAEAWTEQPGFPVLTYREFEEDGKSRVELRQERFTLNDPEAARLLWKVPVAIGCVPPGSSAAAAATETVLLEDAAHSFPLVRVRRSGEQALKLNFGDAGFYRVQYSAPQLAGLRANFPALPDTEKLSVLGDVWAMVNAGRGSPSDYFSLVQTLRAERSLAVMDSILGVIGEVGRLENGQPGELGFRAFAASLLRPIFESLGWDPKPGEARNDLILRGALLEELGRLGDQEILTEARRRFGAFKEDASALSPNLRVPVLRLVGRYADEATYRDLHERARTSMLTEEKRLYYDAMQQAADPALAVRTMELSLGDEMRPPEKNRNLARVAEGGNHGRLVWDFFRKNDVKLLSDVDSFRRHQYIPSLVRGSTEPALADELLAYVRTKEPGAPAVEAEKAAELVRERAALRQRAVPQIDSWIRENAPRKP